MPDESQDAGDGTPGVVVVRAHDHHQKILKLSIPALTELRSAPKREPKRSDYLGAYDTIALASAKAVGPFFDPTAGYRAKMSGEVRDNVKLGGLAWIDGKLAYTLHRYFGAGGTHWQLTVGGRVRSPQRTGGYICAAPKWWADAHLGGRRWLSGMITPQIHGTTNLGPGLYAFHPDEAKGDRVPATVLAEFPWSSRNAKVYPGASRCDYWRGVAFLDDGEKYGVFFIGSKGTPVKDKPFEGDDYGHGTDDRSKHHKPSGKDPFSWVFDRCDHTRGYHCYPYRAILLAFDPDEYVAVAEGAKKPWDVRHYEEIDFSKLLVDDCRYMVCGIGVDEASGLLYIGADWGHRDADPFEGTPAVHVWRWRSAK
jgi:hypothetical protein